MTKRIIILGAVVLLVVAAWSGAWFYFAGLVRHNIELQAEADGVTSPRVTCGTLAISGFPFRFDADCSTAEIVSGDIVATVPGIRASVLVYRPNHILASALGPAGINDTFTGLRNSVAWSGLEASLRVENWRIANFSLVGRDLVWSDTLVGDTLIAQTPQLEAHLLDIPEQHDAERRTASLAGYFRAQDAVVPGLTLTGTNAEIELEATGLPDDVRNWGDPVLPQLWQQNGGQLRLVSARGSDGASNLDAEGALALDEAGFIDGTITIGSTGVAERIGPLLEEPARTLVLGTPGADGRYANLLTFRAGALFSGLVPIASIPSVYAVGL